LGARTGIEVDAACCLTSENLDHLDDIPALAHTLPVQSLTISRLLPMVTEKRETRFPGTTSAVITG
jgi:hypothetical protein